MRALPRTLAAGVAVLAMSSALGGCGSDDFSAVDAADATVESSSTPSALPSQEPSTVDPEPAELFAAKYRQVSHLTDPNGYQAVVTENVSDWEMLTAEQTQSECNSDDFADLDDETSTVWAQRMSVSTDFPDASVGSWSDGGSLLMADFELSGSGSDSGEGLTHCVSSDSISDDNTYGFQSTYRAFANIDPDNPDANVTVYRVVPKTPNNPDGTLADDLRGQGSILLGAIADPSRVIDGLTTGQADDFESYYTKFAAVGTDGPELRYAGDAQFGSDPAVSSECIDQMNVRSSWQVPIDGTFATGTSKPSSKLSECS